ncbi:hypothetical protein FACS1894163_13240 [Spirochaetia bacterium]|nr:hypothetical protein FACS1894163_13240 [Spirochaetia bacterium]
MHVDGDDWLELNALKALYERQQETGADVVVGSFNRHYEKKIVPCIFSSYEITERKCMIADFLLYSCKNVWGKLYRSSLFTSIEQPAHLVYGEDAIVNVQIFSSEKCNKAAFINNIVYNYNCSSGGISQGRICSKVKVINYIDSYVFIRDFLIEKNYFNFSIKKYFYQYIYSSVFLKAFFSMTKRDAIVQIRKAKFPFIYFSFQTKIIFYNILHILFLINAQAYKTIISCYSKMRF